MNITSHKEELKDRIDATRKRLDARITELRADGREQARATLDRLEARLRELQGIIGDGWDRLTEGAAAKLETWLSKVSREEKDASGGEGGNGQARRQDTLDEEAR
jgi:hypothetical protein